MNDDETLAGPTPSAKAGPGPGPDEAELSRMAREAVRQPADPRLDRQLARMGLIDDEPAAPRAGQATERPAEAGSEVELLTRRLRRVELILGVLIVAIGILAVVEVVLLLR